ncbi:hypothetical protein D3C72_1442900 [compost metagenome]
MTSLMGVITPALRFWPTSRMRRSALSSTVMTSSSSAKAEATISEPARISDRRIALSATIFA